MRFQPNSTVLTTGDTAYLTGTVYDDAGIVLNLTTYTVRACFQNGRGLLVGSIVAQSSSTTGASWSTGVLAIYMTPTQSGLWRYGDAYLEIELTSSGGIITTLPLVRLDVQVGAMS